MSTTFFIFIAFCLAMSGVAVFMLRSELAEAFGKWQSLVAFPVLALAGVVITGLVFLASYGSAVHDTEIWNGQVTGKQRVHGHYLRSYSCNCRQVCSGSGNNRSCSTVCDTCYEDRYTVDWSCNTTIGKFTIEHYDRSSRSVYMSPDPARYTNILNGDPVSKTSSYTNYVQAVPDSLFKPASEELKKRFAKLIPEYPDNIYDIYKINRFVTPGFYFADTQKWNEDISNLLKTRGPAKQVNLIVVVAKTEDRNFIYALQDAWEGANKNDVVLVIGSPDGQKISWVDVISWTKRELFKVQLRDEVFALGTIQREKVMSIVASQIDTNFERRRMREFSYLKNDIDPPMWLMTSTFVVLMLMYGGLIFAAKAGKISIFRKKSVYRRRF
jgi:hypothetical protein